MQEMSDTLRATFRRVLKLENRRAAVRPGRVERITDFRSAILGKSVAVVTPGQYVANGPTSLAEAAAGAW